MIKNVDVLVIGGGPASVISAVTTRRYYKDKNILVIKDIKESVIPCGIPYMFKSLDAPDDNKMGNLPLEKNNIGLVVDEVIKIEPKSKTVETKKGEKYAYEKLIIATGSTPAIPPIPGIDKNGVYYSVKEMGYLKNVIEKVKRSKSVVVLGGGFIGIEFADELSKIKGLNVYLIEALPDVLSNSFDKEFSVMAEEKLAAKGVKVLTGVRVEKIEGKENVEKVVLSNGKELSVDAVMLGIGAIPNYKLADDAGLNFTKGKGIWVDEYMKTSDPDIFAVGDCAVKRDFYTHKSVSVMLASTATAEARVAGSNLYKIKLIRENKGTIAVYSTYVDGLALASAGLTENTANKEGFEFITGSFEGVDKHPASMPGVNKIKVKLVFSKQSGIILGGQVAGGISCGEMINVIGVAIQKRMSFTEFETLQMATHPYLTSAPTMYPLVLAAQAVEHKF